MAYNVILPKFICEVDNALEIAPPNAPPAPDNFNPANKVITEVSNGAVSKDDINASPRELIIFPARVSSCGKDRCAA